MFRNIIIQPRWIASIAVCITNIPKVSFFEILQPGAQTHKTRWREQVIELFGALDVIPYFSILDCSGIEISDLFSSLISAK